MQLVNAYQSKAESVLPVVDTQHRALNLPELCLWVSWTWVLSLRGGVSHAHFLQNVCLKFFFFSWNKLIFHLVSVVRGLCCCPSSL